MKDKTKNIHQTKPPSWKRILSKPFSIPDEHIERYDNLLKLVEEIKIAYPGILPIIARWTPKERRDALDAQYAKESHNQFLTTLSRKGQLSKDIWSSCYNYYAATSPIVRGHKSNARGSGRGYNVHHRHPRYIGGDNSFDNMEVLYHLVHALFDDMIAKQLSSQGVKNINAPFQPELILTPAPVGGKSFYQIDESIERLNNFYREYINYCRNMGVISVVDGNIIGKQRGK